MTDMYTKDYYRRTGLIETEFRQAGVLRPDQASAFCYMFLNGHNPETILSIGCGEGILESFIEQRLPNVSVLGTDTSTAIEDMYRGKYFQCISSEKAITLQGDKANTILMCEVLEHLNLITFTYTIRRLSKWCGRLIITNRLEYWPIDVNDWDHVMRIDDKVFDRIAQLGDVVFRHGSHLVLDIGKDQAK